MTAPSTPTPSFTDNVAAFALALAAMQAAQAQLNTFVNGSAEDTYTTTDGTPVKSLLGVIADVQAATGSGPDLLTGSNIDGGDISVVAAINYQLLSIDGGTP